MDNKRIFTDFGDFLRTYLPGYYRERIYKELPPAEAGRKAAEEVMKGVKINVKLFGEIKMKKLDEIKSFKEAEKCLRDFEEMMKLIGKYSLKSISKSPIYEVWERGKGYSVSH